MGKIDYGGQEMHSHWLLCCSNEVVGVEGEVAGKKHLMLNRPILRCAVFFQSLPSGVHFLVFLYPTIFGVGRN